ncbi:MAG: hypothetical protein RMJ38_05725 [candidate division WOR-3 bacterium]|nr:hypothetical protein [candidate division WOR-3 bacterium]MDW8150922.1 hypothetical protein [candidate division WOR-3 bacterium]
MQLDIKTKVGKIVVRGLKDKPGIAADIFTELSKKNIQVLCISFDTATKGRADLAFVVYKSQLEEAKSNLYALLYDEDIEILSDERVILLIFSGIEGNTQLIADAFNLVASSGANIEMISSSSNEVYLLIKERLVDSVVDMFKAIYPKSYITVDNQEI